MDRTLLGALIYVWILGVLQPYGDVQTLAERVRTLLGKNTVAEPHLAAANQFALACKRIKAGKNPDALGFFDDGD